MITSNSKIRYANVNDLTQLVAVDQDAYGEYGAGKDYFLSRLESTDAKILVAVIGKKITGFTVLELIRKGKIPSDYSNLSPNTPPKDKWIQISSFTTKSNYIDTEEDKKLVDAIENFGRDNGYETFGTCLSVDHPYPAAFRFWEQNDYKKMANIQWVGSPKEPINCYLYLKQLLTARYYA